MAGPKAAAPAGDLPIPKSKRGIKAFFVDVIRELKKVTWPKPAETNRMTGIVMAICALVVLILTVMSISVNTVISILTTGKV